MLKRLFKLNGLTVALLLLGLTLTACGDSTASKTEAFPTPAPNPSAGKIIEANPPGPVPNAKLNFPVDEAPHDVITEWWYYTGHLTTDDGAEYGFEYVIFQGIRANFPVGYVSHFAITDLNNKSFKFNQRIVAAARKVEFGSPAGFNLAVGDWTMQGQAGTDRLKASLQDGSYGLDLTVKDQKGLTLHGGGLFSYGPAGSSYYYSRTRLDPSGTLLVGGQPHAIKGGVAWMDHQWGNFVPLSGGWDWFSLHLDDNSELMVYYLRDEQNKVVDVFGSYVPPCAGPCTSDKNKQAKSVDLRREDFAITPTAQWTSPATGGVYPAGWKVEVKSKDAPALNLNVTPVVPNQELDTRGTTGVIYWEGACTVAGTKDGQNLGGKAYVELTGYAKKATS